MLKMTSFLCSFYIYTTHLILDLRQMWTCVTSFTYIDRCKQPTLIVSSPATAHSTDLIMHVKRNACLEWARAKLLSSTASSLGDEPQGIIVICEDLSKIGKKIYLNFTMSCIIETKLIILTMERMVCSDYDKGLISNDWTAEVFSATLDPSILWRTFLMGPLVYYW